MKSNYEFWSILSSAMADPEHFIEKVTSSRFEFEEYLEVRYEFTSGDIYWFTKWCNKHDHTIIDRIKAAQIGYYEYA